MKKKYYVNAHAQNNEDHEVHTRDCKYMPNEQNAIYLGEFVSCQEAVLEAKKRYSQVNGCATCCNLCHTQ